MSFLLLLPILSVFVFGDGEKNKGRGKHQMPRGGGGGEKWEKRVTKEGKAQKKAEVIRNPDFPDLGILRRSLSKKRKEREREANSEQLDTCGVFAKRGRKEGP